MEYFVRGCVLETLSRDAGCNMDDVARVMSRDEVRKELLDSIPLDYCGKKLFESFFVWFNCQFTMQKVTDHFYFFVFSEKIRLDTACELST